MLYGFWMSKLVVFNGSSMKPWVGSIGQPLAHWLTERRASFISTILIEIEDILFNLKVGKK